jgi:hypothetical protein
MWPLYNLERERDLAQAREDRIELARLVARETARLLLPAWGYELKEASPASHRAETVEIVVDGERRRVPAPPPGCYYDARGSLVGLTSHTRGACDPHVFVDGKCRGCDLQRAGNGQLRYGDAPPECDAHEIKNGVCVKCGGRDMGGWVTKPTPRVIECSHERHEPFQGQLRCLDCGSVGN